MPVYAYKGYDSKGKRVSGIASADSRSSLKEQLKSKGIYVYEIAEKVGDKKVQGSEKTFSFKINIFGRRRVSKAAIALMTRQFSTLVRSGMPIAESLEALTKQTEDPKLKLIISSIYQNVTEGITLSDSMGRYRDVFGDLYVNMVKAGESSGTLDIVLERLADLTESQDELSQKIIGALFYPIIMVVVGTLIMGVLFVWVLPKLTRIFEEAGAALPLITKIVIGISQFSRDWWYVVIFIIGALYWGIRSFLRTEKGRYLFFFFLLVAPIFGNIVELINMERFSRTLGTLLKSGVPIIVSLDIVKSIMNNRLLQDAVEMSKESVSEGSVLYRPLEQSGLFPPILTHMISIGEKTGQLEDMLLHAARSYENQLTRRIANLTSLLEPIMIVLMGGAVFVIIISVLVPILRLNELIR